MSAQSEEENALKQSLAISELRLNALEHLVTMLGTVLLNRVKASDLDQIVKNMYAAARTRAPEGSSKIDEDRHTLTGAQLIMLLDRIRGDQQSPEDVVHRQRPD